MLYKHIDRAVLQTAGKVGLSLVRWEESVSNGCRLFFFFLGKRGGRKGRGKGKGPEGKGGPRLRN